MEARLILPALRRGAGRERHRRSRREGRAAQPVRDFEVQFYSGDDLRATRARGARRVSNGRDERKRRRRVRARRTSGLRGRRCRDRDGAPERSRSVLRPLELRHRGPEQHVLADRGRRSTTPTTTTRAPPHEAGRDAGSKCRSLRTAVSTCGSRTSRPTTTSSSSSDIEQKYNRLTGGAPAQRARTSRSTTSNEQAPTRRSTSSTPRSTTRPSWDPTNWNPTSTTTSSARPSSRRRSCRLASAARRFTAPSEFSPSEFSPSECSPSEWSPSEFSPSEFSAGSSAVRVGELQPR